MSKKHGRIKEFRWEEPGTKNKKKALSFVSKLDTSVVNKFFKKRQSSYSARAPVDK